MYQLLVRKLTPSQPKSRQAITKFLRTFEEKSHFYCLYASRGFYLFHITCHIIFSILFHNKKKNPTWKQHNIKPNITCKKKEISYPWKKPCRLSDHCWAPESGFQQQTDQSGLCQHKPGSHRAVLLSCLWTEDPCNDNHKTHLSSEKVTNELIHAAYKLFTTTLNPLKTNGKANFKYREQEPPVLSASACKTFCTATDTSLASAPLLKSLKCLDLLFHCP